MVKVPKSVFVRNLMTSECLLQCLHISRFLPKFPSHRMTMWSVYLGGPSDSDYKDDDDRPEEEGQPRWPHPRGCCDRVSLIALP